MLDFRILRGGKSKRRNYTSMIVIFQYQYHFFLFWRMPGHVKLGKAGEPDPDPSPYLVISMDMKREAMAKPYDAKKSVWVPDGDGGFLEAMLDSESGGKTTVMCGHEVT